MTALGWKADTHPGRMSALTDTGRSGALIQPDLNDSFRPEADTRYERPRRVTGVFILLKYRTPELRKKFAEGFLCITEEIIDGRRSCLENYFKCG